MEISYSSDEFAGLSGDGSTIGFQRVQEFQPPKWPGQDVPQQFHLDFSVQDLPTAEKWVLDLGATPAPLGVSALSRVYVLSVPRAP
jgi:hypothetical protein